VSRIRQDYKREVIEVTALPLRDGTRALRLPASPSGFLMTTASVDQQSRTPSFRYKIGTTEREKKRYAAP
jgi:hypothetical protein